MKSFKLLVAFTLLFNFVFSQCPPYVVNLTGQPEGTWMSPSLGRDYKCCSNNKAECIQFQVTLDPRTAGVQFEFYDGAPAYGSQDWQLNCDGVLHNVRDTICISGVGPHTITFCKPGNNEAVYYIRTIAKPTFPENDTLRRGCYQQIMGYGLRNAVWNSIYPGTAGQYNNLLNCTTCVSPIAHAPNENIPYVDYYVCADPTATMCGYTLRTCDTVRVYFADSLKASVTPNPAVFCESAGGVTLAGSHTGGDGPYTYSWVNSGGTVVSASQNYFATSQNTFTFDVKDRFYSPTCPAAQVSVPVSKGQVPVVDAGSPIKVCAEGGTIVLNGSVTPSQGVLWSGGGGSFMPNANVLSPTYIPTNDEINAGSLYLYLSSTGAGNGCINKTDSVLITFSDTLKAIFNAPLLNCYNSSGTLSITMQGGVGPFSYKWNNGATSASTTASEGNYCVYVKDSYGCEKEFCTTLDAPSALDLQTSSIDVAINGGTNGSAIVSASGGVGPYTYTWNTTPVQYNDTASGLGYGVYTVTVVDAKGCSRQVSVVVNEPRCLGLTATYTVKDVKCYGSNKGSATVFPQGGSAPYTYLWPDAANQTTPTALNLYAGTYQAIITDAIGCKEIVSLNITQPEPLDLSINHTDVTTVSGSNGSATAVVLGGTPPYVYNWSNGGATATINNLSAGNYSLVVYDFNKCSISDSVKITGPLCNTFNIYVTGTDVSCNGVNDGTASVITINGVSPFTYLWSNGQTGSSVSNLAPGTYSVNVTDKNGCVEFKNITIYQPNPLTASLSNTNVSCYGLLDGTVDLTVNGGTFPYTFSWSNGSQVEDIAYLGAGNYSVVIEDNRNCQVTKSVTITQPSQLGLTFSSVNNLCYGGFNGSIDLTVNGGQPPYTYSWNHGATTEDLTGLSAGAYVVTVKDGNSCQTNVSSPIVISEPDSVYITLVSKTDADCRGNSTGSATVQALGGSGSYSYLWNDALAQTTATASGLASGTYTVRVLDNNGCTVPKFLNVTIGEPAAVLSVNATSQAVLCYGGNSGKAFAAVTGGTSPYTYSWSNGSTNDTAYTLTAGSYSVTITDNKGCTASASVSVTQPNAALSSSFTKTNINCYAQSTGSANVSVSGGTSPYTYLWNTGEATAGIVAKPAGTYTVTIRDFNACILTSSVTLTQPDTVLYVKSSSQTNVLCFAGNNGAASVTPFGGTSPYTYSWSNGAVTNAINNLTAGNYSVIVTDALGCTTSKSFTITQPNVALSLNISSVNVLCHGNNTGSATANVSGGTSPYTYSWSNGVTTSLNSNLVAGTYTVLVTDKNGCTISGSKTITQPSAPITSSFNKTNILCFGNSTGAATVVPAGGTSPYTYSWNTGETTAGIVNKPAGTYTVVIKDANLCTLTSSVTLTQPASALSLSGVSQVNVLCFGNATGSASVTPAGGVAPYTYTWSNGTYNSSINNLTAGNYSVTVKDNNGCSVNQSFTITQPAAPLGLTTGQTNILCYGFSTGAANVVAAGGTSPYTYTWSNGKYTSSINNLAAGTYSVTVKDNNGCSANTSVNITQNTDIQITDMVTPSSCGFPDNSGAINLTVAGGGGTYTYAWSGPSGYTSSAEDISGLSSGAYSLVLTDQFSCSKTKNYTVTAPGTLALNSTVSSFNGGDNISCYDAADGSISVGVMGGTSPFSYSWLGPNGYTSNLEDIQNLEPGEYTLTVTDFNGCKNGLNEVLTQPEILNLNITPSSYSGNFNISCAGSTDGSTSLSVSGGNTNYTYSWSGPNGFTASTKDLSSIEAGIYTVIVNDANLCADTATIELLQPDTISFTYTLSAYSGAFNISCAGSSDGSISAAVVGGDSTTYAYNWQLNGNPLSFNQPNISGLVAGNYTLNVTDDNGCTTTQNITLTQPDTLKAVANVYEYIGGINVSCYNAKDGSISVTTTGGDNTTYNFEWVFNGSVISTNEDISSIGIGEYEFTVTDANSCRYHVHEFLSGPDSLIVGLIPTVYSGGFNITCNNSLTGGIGTSVSGGTAAYQYAWTGSNSYSSDLDSISSLGAGSYNLTLTDTNGCIATASYTLTQPDTFSIELTTSQFSGGYNVSCAGVTNGYINSITTGGDSLTYNYVWTYNGMPTTYVGNNISGLAAGLYELTVSDANGCSKTVSFNVTEPDTLKSPLISPEYTGGNQIRCFGESNAVINSNITGGDPNSYSITWTYNGSFYASDSTSLHNLNAGTYILTVYDNNKCLSGDTVVVTEPDLLNSSAVLSDYNGYGVSCANSTNGNINLTADGGVAPYTFSWSNSETTEDIDTLSANTYSVIVTDVNNCSASFNYTITEPSVLNVIATAQTYNGGNNISCFGLSDGSISSVVGGGVPAYTYTWTSGASVLSSDSSVAGLTSGVYTLEVADLNGCVKTQQITLNQPVQMADTISAQVYAGGVNIKCYGDKNGNINFGVTGGTTPFAYAWTGPNGYIYGSQYPNNVYSGWYYVTASDQNNCKVRDSIFIAQPDVLDGSGVVSDYHGYGVSCYKLSDGGIDVTMAGGIAPYTYSWTNDLGTLTNSNEDLANVPAGNYYIIVTDQNSCMKSIPFEITQPDSLEHTNTISDYNGYNVSCYGSNNGQITTEVLGGVANTYNYTWTSNAGYLSYNADISNLFANTYYLEIKDANNCIIRDTIVMIEPNALDIKDSALAFIGGLNISCNSLSDGEIYTNVTGGVGSYNYSWTFNNTSFNQTTGNITSLQAGTYMLVVTDQNECNETTSITLSEPLVLSIADSVSNYNGFGIDCYGNNSGTINIIVSGGNAGYSYQWDNQSTAANQTQLVAGTYSIIVRDTNGCTVNKFITLTDPLKLISSYENSNYNGFGVKCNNDTNGFASVSVAGGITPYSISWSNSQAGAQLSDVGAGSYIYQVLDLNGCISKDTVVITEPTSLDLSSLISSFNGYGVKCYGDTNGTVDLSVLGGVSPYTYSWSNGSQSQDLTSVGLGTFDVTVTDLNQCKAQLSASITQPSAMSSTTLLSNYNGFNLKCFNDGTGSVDLEVVGGVSGYTYSWSNGSTSQDLAGLQAGNYSVLITDLNGCKLFNSVKLSQPDTLDMTLIPQVYAGGFNISCNGLSDGAVNSAVTGGTGVYTYSWSGNGASGSSSSISGLAQGTYVLFVNDNNACAINKQVVLTQPTPVVSSATTVDAYCVGNTGSVDLSVEGGVSPYTYSWSNGANTQDLTGVAAATYTVDIRDANACLKTQTVVLNAVSNLTVTGVVKNVNCYNAKDGSISLIANGTAPFVYAWNNGASTSTVNQLSGGTYSVIVTDFNGCSNTFTYVVNENTQIVVDSVISLYNGIFNISAYAANDGFIELTTSGGVSPYSYNWSNDETTSTINNLTAGTYVVEITDAVGCKVTKRYKLIQPFILEMPSGYTPNNDGYNDAFVVHGIEAFPVNTITVFNRWGNIVYQKDAYNNEWRGVNNSGDNLPDGTYFVILDINGGEKVLKGYVDLRRK